MDNQGANRLTAVPGLLLLAIGYLALAGSVIFLAASAIAFFGGWALPTTAIIRWSPLGEWAALAEPAFPFLLLALAALGALVNWAGLLFAGGAADERREASALRFLRRWGPPILICLLWFSMSAMWAGLVRATDPHASSIGGLIPYNDAGGYFASAHDEAKDGVWNVSSLRRPLAAAFRSVLTFLSGYAYVPSLLLQSALLSLVTAFAVWSVARWRGIWAGLAFFAFTYLQLRYYAATTLTEPLGLFWALLGVPFFIAGLRRDSLGPSLLAFAAVTLAQMTRMGALLVVPAMMVWLAWRFGKTLKARLAVFGLCLLIVAGVFAFNTGLSKTFGTSGNLTGSNFSYTLCGLTLGTDWTGCPDKLAREGRLAADPAAIPAQLYPLAWENFRENPAILFSQLYRGGRGFVAGFPRAILPAGPLLAGSLAFIKAPLAIVAVVFLLASAGAVGYTLVRRGERGEIAFWVLFWAGIVVSALFIYTDGGARVMIATYPLTFVFLSLAFADPPRHEPAPSPPSPQIATRTLAVAGISTLALGGLLFFLVPWFAHGSNRGEAALSAATQPGEHLVSGGRRMTGLLVVDDSAPLRNDVPTIHMSAFTAIIDLSQIEVYQGLLHPQSPALPFGFVFAPRLGRDAPSDYQYIVPPEVLERHDVAEWRFTLADWQAKPGFGPYWFLVTHAEPVEPAQ